MIDETQTALELEYLILHWMAKQGAYKPTSMGVSSSKGTRGVRNFKQINEERAYNTVQYYTKLLDWLDVGNHLKQETRVKVHQAWLRATKG